MEKKLYILHKERARGGGISRAPPRRLAMIIAEMCGCATATLQAKFVTNCLLFCLVLLMTLYLW